MYWKVDKRAPIRTVNHIDKCIKKLAKNPEFESVNIHCIYPNKGKVEGVKGYSVLSRIPYFDLIQNCPIESLHCLWEGVVKQFCDLWFNSKHHNEKWYIGEPTSIGKVDNFIQLNSFSKNG